MSLVQSFSTASVFGQPQRIVLTDTSSGSDALVKSRIIYLQKYDATYLTPSGEEDTVIVQAEVKARCFIGGMSLRTTSDLITVSVVDPVLGSITIATYTQLSEDTTLALLITKIINTINAGVSGYTAINSSSTTLYIVAKTGLGDTINGLAGDITYPGGGTSGTFSGGVSQITLPILSQNYIYWDYDDTSIALDILNSDTALSITVKWLGATNNILYSYTVLTVFNMYSSQLDDFLISGQQARPNVINDTNYYINRMKLRVAINDAINSITQMSDITNSQQACDRGMFFVDNQSLFF